MVDILQSQENRVGKFFRETVQSGNAEALASEFVVETVEYADYKVLESEAWLAKAEWSEAKDALDLADLLYDFSDDMFGADDILAMRGKARALKLWGDLAWMSGSTGEISSLEMRVDFLVYRRRQDCQNDALTAAYVYHFLARLHTAEYLQAYYLWFQYKDDPERAEQATRESRSNASKADEAFAMLERAEQEYLSGNFIRETSDLDYDRILIAGLNCPDDIDAITHRYTPQGRFVKDPVLVFRAELARFKVIAIHGSDEIDITILGRLTDQFEAVVRRATKYWLADCFAAICILMVQQGDSRNTKRTLKEFRKRCIEIGRQDRLAHVEKAIEAWWTGDRVQFKREFAYLLTF